MDGVNGITIEKTIPENDNELENLTIGLNLSEAINELEKSDENLSRSDYIIAEDGNELSGNIVTFEADEELPLKKLVVDIEPVQDLHGYDHPWPAGGGKNLLDRNAYTTNVALDDDGNVTSAGSTSSVSAHIPVIAGAQYTFSCICNSTGYKRVAAYAQDGTFIAPLLAKITGITSGEFRTETFTIPANAAYLIVGNNTSDTNIQLELGSYATAYEPYSNICPISGWTGCNIACNGDNLINPVLFLPGNFDASGNVVNTTSVNSKHTEKLPIKGGITYTLVSTSLITTNSFYCFYDKDKRFISSSLYLAYAEKSTFTAPENACFIACSIRHASDLPFGMSMYLGRTDKNKPYSGTVYPITFPEAGTVYGGALDVVSGVLTSTHRYLLLDDTLTYVVKNNERFDINLDEANIARTEDNSILLKNAYCSFLQVGNGHLTGNSSGITSVLAFLNISEWYSGEVSNAALRSYFNDMINAEKPCAVCYELATPITYQLTPQQITTLLGTNNIWADAGDIEVTYSNNTSIYKRKKLDSIFSILNKDDIIKALNWAIAYYNDTNGTFASDENFKWDTKLLSIGGSITATGNLTITGNANLNNETYANSLTAGSLLVTGNTNFTQIPTAPTPANSSNDTSVATTAFVNTVANKYLLLSGGAMTGNLILNADPTNESQAATKRYVDNAFTANDAMVFKGTIGSSEDQAMYEYLPTEHEIGWTYRVVTEGFYDQLRCEVGDLIVCIKSSNEETSGDDGGLIIGDYETFGDPTNHWIVVQSNIDGTVIGPTESASGIAVFTGTTGKAIRDSGKQFTTTAPAANSTDTTIPTSKAVWTTVESSRIEVVRLI